MTSKSSRNYSSSELIGVLGAYPARTSGYPPVYVDDGVRPVSERAMATAGMVLVCGIARSAASVA